MIKQLIAFILAITILCIPITSFADDNNNTSSDEWTWLQDMASDAQSDYMVGSIKSFMAANRKYLKFSYATQKAIVNWSYDKFNKLAQSLGYTSLNDYYNQVAYSNKSGIQRFFYTATGLKLMDDLTKALLQEYGIDLELADTKTIYSGKYFIDSEGNSCYIYIVPRSYNEFTSESSYLQNTQIGSTYLYDGKQYFQQQSSNNIINHYITYNNNSIRYYLQTYIDYVPDLSRPQNRYNSVLLTDTNMTPSNVNDISKGIYLYGTSWNTLSGNMCIIYSTQDQKYYLGVNNVSQLYEGWNRWIVSSVIELPNLNANNTNISIDSTGAPLDDFSAYKAGIIAIEQGVNDIKDLLENMEFSVTVENSDDDEPPEKDPNINVGIVNNMPIQIQLPNLDDLVPDPIQSLPHGFSIPGLRYKFPFCIPFDLIAVYEFLDTEPQAPYFATTINFATFHYNLEIDLEDYNMNQYMINIRKFFLLLYIFGLLFVTPKLLKA